MRISPMLFTAVLCAASVGAAHAQTATPVRATGGSAKVPSGMNFSYDAQRGVISTTGVQLKTSTIKSNSVSPTTGTVDVVINIKVLTHFQSGTTYHCSLYILGGIIDTDTGTVDGGVETANTFATGSGGSYTCAFKVPYSWTLASDPGADSGLILGFGAAAVNPQSEVQHSTLQIDGIENLPASGSTASYAFNVRL